MRNNRLGLQRQAAAVLLTTTILIVVGGSIASITTDAVADQWTNLGARWYCLTKFKMAGISPNNNDPMFLNCIRQRSEQVERQWDKRSTAAHRAALQRQQQLRREYGGGTITAAQYCAAEAAKCYSCPNGRGSNGGACYFDSVEQCRDEATAACR